MQAEDIGDGILLSWNRNAAAARSVKQGILHIQDGSEQRTISIWTQMTLQAVQLCIDPIQVPQASAWRFSVTMAQRCPTRSGT
jgi:hypothetical protein